MMSIQLLQIFIAIVSLSLVTTQCMNQKAQVQNHFPGACATDIGVGDRGIPWVLGCGPPVGAGDYYIFSWNGAKWDMIPGVAVRIAVEPDGTPWIVNKGKQIYKRSANGWQQVAGCARDIAVGQNSSAWILGCKSSGTDGFEIYTRSSSGWDRVAGAATKIAVDPDGTPWIINAGGQIYKRSADSWKQIPGCAKDIGVGRNDSAWILGCTSAGAGGFEIQSWDGSKWRTIPGSATGIAVEANGTAWVINVEGKTFRL